MLIQLITAVGVLLSADPQAPRRVAAAGPGNEAAMTALAVRAEHAPVIDGKPDDVVWQKAPKIGEFVQFAPREGAAPSFKTEFQVGYDNRNLYIFVRAYDPHPDSIMHALSRRDVRGPSDQIIVYIDSYNDHRTGYNFDVNPDGVKRDYAMYDDGNEDDSWNGVWDVATTVDAQGWTAEFRIPLSQLRYADAPSHTFGFGVWRDIERYKERVSWPIYSPSKNGMSSQLGRVTGISGIVSPHRLEATPYVVAKNESRVKDVGYGRAQGATVGGDVKYGITPNVTLDLTVNPDFGQVEADPAVLNLGTVETFRREKRPFFTEGTGLYRFALNCYIVVDCNTNEGLFYSRRIGRAPQLLDTNGDATSPTATPIAAAAKLTGRTSHGLSFGMLDAVTEHVNGVAQQTIEPRTNYAVARMQQDLRDGQAGASVAFTAVNRALDSWSADALRKNAYAGGANFRNKFGGGQYQVSGSISASRVEGSPAAILATQQDGVHDFQRPDDNLRVDSTRTSLTGHAEEFLFGKYGGGILRFETSLEHQSPGYEVNDLGYLRRADQKSWNTWASLVWNKPRAFYKRLQWNVNQWNTWTDGGLQLDRAINTNMHLNFKNNWNIHGGGTIGQLGKSFCDRCTRGGPALRVERAIYPWFGINGDDRNKVVPYLWFNFSSQDGGRSHYRGFSPSADLHMSTRLVASIGFDISTNHDDSQWLGNFTDDAGKTHYSVAQLEQRTQSLNLRVNYTATPDLTFELYAQPFITTGTYTNVREVTSPYAATYDARYSPYTPPAGTSLGFDFSQLRSNAVVRWEYRSGSTLFLVWTHGRQAYSDDPSTRSWGTEYRDLFQLHPENTFLIKVAYWLNR
jgi:hypothetical protein